MGVDVKDEGGESSVEPVVDGNAENEGDGLGEKREVQGLSEGLEAFKAFVESVFSLPEDDDGQGRVTALLEFSEIMKAVEEEAGDLATNAAYEAVMSLKNGPERARKVVERALVEVGVYLESTDLRYEIMDERGYFLFHFAVPRDQIVVSEAISAGLRDKGLDPWDVAGGGIVIGVKVSAVKVLEEEEKKEDGRKRAEELYQQAMGKLEELAEARTEQDVKDLDLAPVREALDLVLEALSWLDKTQVFYGEVCRSATKLALNVGDKAEAARLAKLGIESAGLLKKKSLRRKFEGLLAVAEAGEVAEKGEGKE